MRDRGEGERFVAAFSALTSTVGDDPHVLAASWEANPRLQRLCDEIYGLVRLFEVEEEWSSQAFTHPVSAAGAEARRDYDERWQSIVTTVANRDLHRILDELMGDQADVPADTGALRVHDELGDQIDSWKREAKEDADSIERILNHIHSEWETGRDYEFDWVDDSLRAWRKLEVAGLDIQGALWRRRALPHVLVPTHVARRYGTDQASLYRRLHQAGKAFVFGTPLAALALQRAVLEEVLEKHWGAERGLIQSANIRDLSWERRATRLKRFANQVLHGDPNIVKPGEIDRAIIEGFLILRLLIERAPAGMEG